jgi:hypothetical protein
MRMQAETWESWVYPLLLGPVVRCARVQLPRTALVTVAAPWLRCAHLILSTPYFSAVAQAGALVLPDGSLRAFLRDHLHFVIRFYLEMADMIDSRRETIKARVVPRVSRRLCGMEAAMESGRGVLMPTVQTTVPLRMIFSDFPKNGRYNLVLHRQYVGITRMLEKADQSWNFLFLEDAPARRMVDALRRGEVVICNIDHAYPETEVTLAPVLGHTAIVPSGIFRMAHRYDSLVVPLTCTEEGNDVVISADQIFDWDGVDALPVARMLERIHPVLDSAVLHCPACWFGWGNLINRWQAWRDYVRDPS